MQEWRKAYPDQPIAMWLYNTYPLEHTNNSGFNCFPGFFAHEAARQYRFFHENDFSAGIFQCGMNGDVETYMQFEWMIDPTRDPDEMLDEYSQPGEEYREEDLAYLEAQYQAETTAQKEQAEQEGKQYS